jgi:hypothetical protein
MKIRAPLILLILVATLVSPADADTLTVSGVFTLTLPTGFFPQKQTGNTFPLLVNANTNYTAYEQIGSTKYSGDLGQYVLAEQNGFQSSPKLAQCVFPAKGIFATKNGVKGIRLLMTFRSAQGQMEMAAYYFQKPDEVEILHAIFYEASANQYVPLFDASAKTVVLK